MTPPSQTKKRREKRTTLTIRSHFRLKLLEIRALTQLLLAMPVLKEHVSKNSLNFANQRRAYLLRVVKKESYEDIAATVVNLKGKHPVWGTVRNICEGFSETRACRPYQYMKCGRKAWKLTEAAQKFVIRRLLAGRMNEVVTSTSLAEELAAEMGIFVEASCIRKLLKKKGYKWLPRSQKRKYSKEDQEIRVRFAKGVLRLSRQALREKLAMSLDGVVLSMPPTKETDRFNYCWGGFTHVWRKSGEANSPQLAGADDMIKQFPLSRAIPLWGGVSGGGFAAVLWHPQKKTNNVEWSAAIRAGRLTDALRQINPGRRYGPWFVLCDNESFLRKSTCMRAYAAKGVHLWAVPPRSPDLNPVEMFWGWLRRQLRLKDLSDLRRKIVPLGKTAYLTR